MSNDEKLTVLAQKELWYSPLFVNDVELENILFYNSIDGVIFQTNRGWFDCGNNSIGTITLFGECHNTWLATEETILRPRIPIDWCSISDDWDRFRKTL